MATTVMQMHLHVALHIPGLFCYTIFPGP